MPHDLVGKKQAYGEIAVVSIVGSLMCFALMVLTIIKKKKQEPCCTRIRNTMVGASAGLFTTAVIKWGLETRSAHGEADQIEEGAQNLLILAMGIVITCNFSLAGLNLESFGKLSSYIESIASVPYKLIALPSRFSYKQHEAKNLTTDLEAASLLDKKATDTILKDEPVRHSCPSTIVSFSPVCLSFMGVVPPGSFAFIASRISKFMPKAKAYEAKRTTANPSSSSTIELSVTRMEQEAEETEESKKAREQAIAEGAALDKLKKTLGPDLEQTKEDAEAEAAVKEKAAAAHAEGRAEFQLK